MDRRARPVLGRRSGAADRSPRRSRRRRARPSAAALGGIALTHGHADHSGAVAALLERCGEVEVAALAWEGATRAIADGDSAGPLTAIATPGHSTDHLAFRAGARALQRRRRARARQRLRLTPTPARCAATCARLRGLLELPLTLICPGHGPLVTDPRAKLEQYLAHRLDRERRLRRGARRRPARADELLDRVWSDAPPAAAARAAAVTLAAHLDKLAEEGAPARRRGAPAGSRPRLLTRRSRRYRLAERRAVAQRPMAVEQRVTFCRICEALCGMVATVEDGVVTKLRPDHDHPLSAGLRVPEGHRDDRRAERPRPRACIRCARPADGEFERVSWERGDGRHRRAPARRSIAAHGPKSVGWYMGNPGAFSYSHTLWVKGFLDGARLAALLHGRLAGRQQPLRRERAALRLAADRADPRPARARSFLLMVGANPLVSHGCVLTAPRVREQLHAIVERGGRVVVVDPRRTETARAVRARRRPARHRRLAAALDAARDLRGGPGRRGRARAPDGRLGRAGATPRAPSRPSRPRRAPASRPARARARARLRGRRRRRGLRPHGLVPGPLRHARRVPARRARTPSPATSTAPAARSSGGRRSRSTRSPSRPGLDTYGKVRSRFGGFPDVIGNLPAALMPREITTPGERQIRAFFVAPATRC